MHKTQRVLAVLTLLGIVIYGILKIWVLQVYARLIIAIINSMGINDAVLNVLRDQAGKPEFRDQTIGWLLYYPSYFLLHLIFIYLLFHSNTKVRNYLMIGLTVVISSLVLIWVGGGILGLDSISSLARTQFKNLFGLPFVLLAIEGGRILYNDLIKLTKNQNAE